MNQSNMNIIYINAEMLYIRYVNDFITIEKFAEWLELPIPIAQHIIEIGKHYNNDRNNKYKRGYVLY